MFVDLNGYEVHEGDLVCDVKADGDYVKTFIYVEPLNKDSIKMKSLKEGDFSYGNIMFTYLKESYLKDYPERFI